MVRCCYYGNFNFLCFWVLSTSIENDVLLGLGFDSDRYHCQCGNCRYSVKFCYIIFWSISFLFSQTDKTTVMAMSLLNGWLMQFKWRKRKAVSIHVWQISVQFYPIHGDWRHECETLAHLGDPLPRVGEQSIVELCEELVCMQRSLLGSHSWLIPLICSESHKHPWHVFSGVKMRQILFGDSWTQVNTGNRVGLGKIINVCQLTMYFRVFRGFSTLTWKHMITFKFTSTTLLSLFNLNVLNSCPLLLTQASHKRGKTTPCAALFPKFTSPPRASLMTTPQFRTCPTVWWWIFFFFFWGGGSWRLYESHRNWGRVVEHGEFASHCDHRESPDRKFSQILANNLPDSPISTRSARIIYRVNFSICYY